jgi:2-polyprenyl-6-methoxyphenol hydroxylase-like FAD-dependent oxidoreductase
VNRVLIVGGGPAGMTAAIALARHGIGCEIVEQELDWRPAGIGIGLQSPPMLALRDLDVLAPIIDRAWHHAVIDVMRPDGVKVAEMPQVNVLGPDDPPFVTMSRMTLHEVLAERLRSFGSGHLAARRSQARSARALHDDAGTRYAARSGADRARTGVCVDARLQHGT